MAGGFLPKNHELTAENLYLDSVQTKDIPAGVVRSLEQVEQKITNVNLTDGSILTDSLVDVSELEPQQDEGIFPDSQRRHLCHQRFSPQQG
ncbi:SAF domain-containing protein [Paenibacillus rhizoplanae]